jgi:glycosyltransferase involved in cell wall biosynthesis
VLQLSARMLRKRVQRRVRWPEKLPAAEARQPASAIEPPAFQPYVIRQPVAGHAARPRIVHAIANFMTGGSSRLVVDLMEGLGSDYAQTVLTSFVPSPPGYVGAQVRELGSGAPASEFEEALAGAALVHVHYWGDCDQPWYVRVFAAAERLGIRMLENVNTPVSPHRSPAVARYVYVSQYVRGVFGHPSYPEEVVYPGSDLSLFTPEPGQPVAHDSVGIVYRLERDKLDERAIEPLIIAVQRRPGTRALVVGGGSLLEPFRRSVEEAGVAAQFTFTGYVAYEALPALYASLAVFVAPVWQESFGQVSTFAMSMGVPVVGYAVGAIPEILGDEALLAPPGDADALAQIIVRLLDEPDTRRAIATRNRQRAQATYSVQSMVERYRSLYASLVETGQVA